MWECSLAVVDGCLQEGLFDPPEFVDGAAACGPCAREMAAREADISEDYSFQLTD